MNNQQLEDAIYELIYYDHDRPDRSWMALTDVDDIRKLPADKQAAIIDLVQRRDVLALKEALEQCYAEVNDG